MAAPMEVTIETLSGKYVLNKSLSDPTEPLFELQGVQWVIRKAMGLATPSLSMEQYVDDAGNVHVDSTLIAAAGINGTDLRVLDWTEMPKKDPMFGETVGLSRFYTTLEMMGSGGEEDKEFLMGLTLINGSPNSWARDELDKHVQSFVKNERAGWTAEQTWGFEEVQGARYYTRRMVVRRGGVSRRARQVYSFRGID